MSARLRMCDAVTAVSCSRGPSLEPVATIEQIMETTVEPSRRRAVCDSFSVLLS